MNTTRKRYSADFKVKVAIEAISGDLTLADLAGEHSLHYAVIGAWKQRAMHDMASLLTVATRWGRPPARPRSVSCWWSVIFWREPPVDEHGSEA